MMYLFLQGYCITAIYSASNRMVNYTLVVPKGGMQIGWYGIGQGTKMAGSNMAVRVVVMMVIQKTCLYNLINLCRSIG